MSGNKFNQNLIYPPHLRNLRLGDSFNLPLNNLPVSLEKLTLGRIFNQPLDFLPIHLKKLHITNIYYSHKLNNLPDGCKFNFR